VGGPADLELRAPFEKLEQILRQRARSNSAGPAPPVLTGYHPVVRHTLSKPSRAALLGLAGLALWTGACGGSSGAASPVDATADVAYGGDVANDQFVEAPPDSGVVDAGFEADGPSDALSAGAACPAVPPEAGTPCDGSAACGAEYLVCEYGTDPRISNSASCIGGHWFLPAGHPLGDASGPPLGDAGCPPTYAAAQISNDPCDIPSCSYPEGTCTCWVTPQPAGDAAIGWSCSTPPLPAGCPPTLAAAQAGAICPSNALTCYYAEGTCTCYASDAGNPWHCTVPAAGCPATRPRLGAACDASMNQDCEYIPLYCAFPTGDLYCSCGGVWVSEPGLLCQ
jgi:hypothetical protein